MNLNLNERKRQLSDESEYLPVTKRMNNLHINVRYLSFIIIIIIVVQYLNLFNQFINSSNQPKESSLNGQQMGLEFNQNHVLTSGLNPNHNCMNGIISETSNSVVNCFNSEKTYSPELDSDQNPIYYESNRILYEAHQQRILRTNRDLFNKKS